MGLLHSDELFEVGDSVTWGNYIEGLELEFCKRYGIGPFTVIEVKPHDNPGLGGHTQLVKVNPNTYFFSGLWFTKKLVHPYGAVGIRKRLIRIV